MRRFICLTFFLFFSILSFGQNSGALKFLGIPVDGPETQFVSQLKTKGFAYDALTKSYKGQFNGQNVNVLIHTNHNLVDRVMVVFPEKSERDIRIEFNRLLSQFDENQKYMNLGLSEPIPDNENISYEITVNNKQYQADFYYFNQDRDIEEFSKAYVDKISRLLPEEEAIQIKESMNLFMELSEEEREGLMDVMSAGLEDNDDDTSDERTIRRFLAILQAMKELADGQVWFMIDEVGSKYEILLFYDNPYNRAHGEDL